MISIVIGVMSYYQANHFNAKVTINGLNVGGLTSDQALEKLRSATLTNQVFVGEELILKGNEMEMGFTADDLSEVKSLLKSQWTFFPSFKEKDLSLTPSEGNHYREVELKNELEQKLLSMNQDLEPPTDAHVSLVDGNMVVSESIAGTQYDVAHLLKEYDQHSYTSDIHLSSALLQPIKEDSQVIKTLEQKLQSLLGHTVEYQVQDQVHSLKGSDVIKNATITSDLEVSIDPSVIEEKIAEINEAQSTLGKDFTFTTHSGNVIEVKGEGYGWALDVEQETAIIHEAFEKGETSASATNIIGNGWSGEGYGYDIVANGGIGDTYAEISIAEQKVWLYRDGELVFSTDVVTGNQSTGEVTSPGVWYILYKRTPYTLNGSSVRGGAYSTPVNYWAPFTNDGQGFHDASWRGNWGKDAYHNDGSSGCVNIQPSMMKQVYDNLDVYQPVVIY